MEEICRYCFGDGGRWDSDVQDQWYWCEHCDAAEKYLSRIKSEKSKTKVYICWECLGYQNNFVKIVSKEEIAKKWVDEKKEHYELREYEEVEVQEE